MRQLKLQLFDSYFCRRKKCKIKIAYYQQITIRKNIKLVWLFSQVHSSMKLLRFYKEFIYLLLCISVKVDDI